MHRCSWNETRFVNTLARRNKKHSPQLLSAPFSAFGYTNNLWRIDSCRGFGLRNYVSLFVNGRLHQVTGADAFLSLAEFLRTRLALTGTKVVCAEGDCGSCTVLCGRADGERFCYVPIDSCIQFVFQLDGTHIVTVEGLSHDGQLTPRARCNGRLSRIAMRLLHTRVRGGNDGARLRIAVR